MHRAYSLRQSRSKRVLSTLPILISCWSVKLPKPAFIFPRGCADKNALTGEFRRRLFHPLSVKCHGRRIPVHRALDEASVCGRGRESGEERLEERSRSETPPPSTDRSTPLMRSNKIQIVTSTRFAQRNGRGREGETADRKPVERANRVLVTSSN